MKIAVRCIYYLAVTPNFLIVDLSEEQWSEFLWKPKARISIIRPYLRDHSASIREISWIPLDGLTDEAKNELRDIL